MSWANDDAHSAKRLINVWTDVLLHAKLGMCETTPNALHGAEIEDLMPIRVDCDCNVYVLCCDGTEKQILTSDQVKAAIAGGVVNGAPQPPAGGGCASYNLQITGGQLQIIPTVVNSGDTIEIVTAEGAKSETAGAGWQCPDGSSFFAGLCLGGVYTYDGAAYIPATPIGKIILYLDGVYYDLAGPFTVPGGIANKTPMLVANYNPADAIQGDMKVQVKVCNNASAPWVKSWNFALVPGPFAAKDGNRATWVAGVGWEPQAITQTQLTTAGMITMPAGVFFDEVDFTMSLGGTAELAFFDGAAYHFDDAGVTSPHPYAHPVTAGWAFEPGGYSGADVITSLTIKGHGVNPF